MRRVLGLSILLCACTSPDKRDTSPTSEDDTNARDYVGKDAQVDAAELRWTSPDEQRRFTRARACFAERGAKWEHFPLRKIGNFVEEEWYRGEEAGGSKADWAAVGTLHYPKEWPEVFGVQVRAGHDRDHEGWSTSFSVSSNGKSILAEGAQVQFSRGKDLLHLGSELSWEIEQSHFSEVAQGDPWAVFEKLRSSPEALRDAGIEHWRALEAKVIAALEKDEVRKCVYGPYEGGGVPPTCIEQVPLAADEKAKELEKVRTSVGRTVELLEQEHVAMHAALLELAPVECF